MRSGPTVSLLARIISTHRSAILQSCGLIETHTQEMFEGRSGGQAESGFVRSSRDSTWLERRQKKREDREHERRGDKSGLREGSDQTYRIMSGASRRGQLDERDQELEWLRRLVRDLKLEARGWYQRRDRDNRERSDGSVGN